MQGKRGLIMGLANDRSLAWGIARALSGEGAELAFSYQGESLEKRVRPLAAELGSFVGYGPRDAPGERAIVGKAHDQPALALHQSRQSCGPSVSNSTFTSSPGCGSSTSSSSEYGPV